MIRILCIVVVAALAVVAIVAKACASEPKKARKGEKAAIMKQLLALSERDNGVTAVTPSRSRTPRATPAKRLAQLPLKPGSRTSQPVGSNQGPC